MRHFLKIGGLNKKTLTRILDTAESFIGVDDQAVKKVPLLRGKTIVNLFFEPSTRTLTTFELAAKRLSADVLNINVATSSTTKGESLLDTLFNLAAMNTDMFIIRHPESGAADFIAKYVAPHVSIINAGDGRHAHPTQAMLDVFTMRKHHKDFPDVNVAIVGDILHSRVARSQIEALTTLGIREVRVIAPRTLLPAHVEQLGVREFQNCNQGLRDVDIIIMLRLQKERMQGAFIPSEHEYFQLYGLTPERLALANPNAIVMHPGPINRGVEISSEVADGHQSVILQQVNYSIAVRMAILSLAISASENRVADES